MYKYTVKEKSIISGDILLLTLQPEKISEQIRFYPGQYAAISYYLGSRPSPTRCFSIVSSPREKYLQFAMRIGGAFTQAATTLEIGDRVDVDGPFGQFTLDPEFDDNLVFIAGGIGVTPFMSILRYATEIRLNKPIRLLYSCRSQDHIPFMAELLEHERQNPNFKVAFFITDGQVTPIAEAQITKQTINEESLSLVTNNWSKNITYFICGPTGFRKNFETILSKVVDDPDRVVTESFTQATKLSIGSKFSLPTLTYSLTALALLFGTGFIMSVDLARAVPKILNEQAASSQNSTSTSPTSSNSSTSTPTSTSTNGNSSSATTNSAPTQTYSQPITSVS